MHVSSQATVPPAQQPIRHAKAVSGFRFSLFRICPQRSQIPDSCESNQYRFHAVQRIKEEKDIFFSCRIPPVRFVAAKEMKQDAKRLCNAVTKPELPTTTLVVDCSICSITDALQT